MSEILEVTHTFSQADIFKDASASRQLDRAIALSTGVLKNLDVNELEHYADDDNSVIPQASGLSQAIMLQHKKTPRVCVNRGLDTTRWSHSYDVHIIVAGKESDMVAYDEIDLGFDPAEFGAGNNPYKARLRANVKRVAWQLGNRPEATKESIAKEESIIMNAAMVSSLDLLATVVDFNRPRYKTSWRPQTSRPNYGRPA